MNAVKSVSLFSSWILNFMSCFGFHILENYFWSPTVLTFSESVSSLILEYLLNVFCFYLLPYHFLPPLIPF